MQAQGWIPRVADELRGTDASLRDEPRFKAILATLDLTQSSGPTMRSRRRIANRSTKPNVWPDSRCFGRKRAMRSCISTVPELDWNRAYRDFLPQVVTAKNTRDYYAVLMRFAAHCDGHTNVYPPEALEDRFYARPPLRTALVEDKVLITALGSPTLARLGLGVGDEVVAIDGEAVRDYAEHRIAPTVSSSTPQDRDVRMYGYELLMGDADAPVHLSVCDARGRAREITVPRKGYDDVIAPKAFEFRKLPGGIVALTLDHFESDAGVKAFEAAAGPRSAARKDSSSTCVATAAVRRMSATTSSADSAMRQCRRLGKARRGSIQCGVAPPASWSSGGRSQAAAIHTARTCRGLRRSARRCSSARAASAAEDCVVSFDAW
jgi:hypothetical protein